jgi:hypothetical protein
MSTAIKVFLGSIKSHAGNFVENEPIWLEKHQWDCGWYWAFGYIGNSKLHTHFESLLNIKNADGSISHTASELFKSTNIKDKEWWVIRDLFVQAYALKNAAEVYQYGGHQTTSPGITDVIKNKERADQINADLAKVLDTVWDVVCRATTGESK